MASQSSAKSLLSPKGDLKFLQECLQLSSPRSKSSGDWVFISMNIKNSQDLSNVAQNIYKTECSFQIGISILDLKRVTAESTNSTVHGFNFVGTKQNYFRKAERNFHFGETLLMDPRIVVESLGLLISSFRSDGQKLALVGHSLKPCMHILREFGLDPAEYFQAYFDTYDIAGEVFECVGRPSFADLLEALEIKFAWLSCAGNYANYLTKAIMALATYRWNVHPPANKEMQVKVARAMDFAKNLVVSRHSKMFPEDYKELPKSTMKPEKVDFRDCVTEKKIRDIRSQNRDCIPSWDETVLWSRRFRYFMLESGGLQERLWNHKT